MQQMRPDAPKFTFLHAIALIAVTASLICVRLTYLQANQTMGTAMSSVPASLCGNGMCNLPEDILSCPQDCSGGPSSVGSVGSTCGDRICSVSENPISCPQDCVSLHPAAPIASAPMAASFTCGDAICSVGETRMQCPQDCGPLPVMSAPAVVVISACGNHVCSGQETVISCPQDCKTITSRATVVTSARPVQYITAPLRPAATAQVRTVQTSSVKSGGATANRPFYCTIARCHIGRIIPPCAAYCSAR